MEITLSSSTNLVDDIWQFRFSRPKPLQFDAGDYVELSLGGAGRRWLTIASSPTQDYLEFITKIGDNPSQFKQTLRQLQPEQSASISPAIGNFNLPPTDGRPLLWVAGGIGITPYLSMLGWLETRPERQLSIDILYAAKPQQHIRIDRLRNSPATVTTLDRRPSLDDILAQTDDNHPLIYLSGPEPLCQQLFQQLLDSGRPRTDLRLDYFEGYESI